MGEREQSISPELIWGSKFKIPTVIGQGSGQGFEFDGLHLPRGWEAAMPELKTINRKAFSRFFQRHCQRMGYSAGEVNFDPLSNVLVKLTVETDPVSELSLAESFFEKERGIYRVHHLRDAKVAIILQRGVSLFLGEVAKRAGLAHSYSFIEGGGEGQEYFPVGLEIPERFLEVEAPLTNDRSQKTFEIQASNVAGRFGLTLNLIGFDERGIPTYLNVSRGSACEFYMDKEGRYHAHNVDTADQALAFQGMVASFVNDFLLIRKGD